MPCLVQNKCSINVIFLDLIFKHLISLKVLDLFPFLSDVQWSQNFLLVSWWCLTSVSLTPQNFSVVDFRHHFAIHDLVYGVIFWMDCMELLLSRVHTYTYLQYTRPISACTHHIPPHTTDSNSLHSDLIHIFPYDPSYEPLKVFLYF